MNSKSKIALGLGILTILSSMTSIPAQAEMNFQDMKGVHDFIKPESEYLSPIYGFTLLGTKTLENMRFYGNYGPKKEGYGCLESASRIHDQLSKNHDCPQDKTTELIQRLFPSQDGANFVANQIDSDIASHLDPETLGKLASQMAEAKDADLADPSRAEALETELKDILFQGLNPKGYYEQQRNATRSQLKGLKQQGKKMPLTPQTGICTDNCHPTELTQLEQKLAALDSILKKLGHGSDDTASISSSHSDDSNDRTPKKGRGKDKDYKELAATLLGALKESRLAPHTYPRNLPEQVLLSYFWKKASHKQDFLPLLQGMSSHLKVSNALNHPDTLKHFLAQKYSKEDFKSADLNGNPDTLAHYLVSHPEKLVFLAEQDKLESKPLPPFLSYAQAKHTSLAQATYPDCGETSVRNFFNIALYDPSQGKFNPTFLEEYKKHNPQLNYHPGLTDFYNTHTDPAASVNQIARDDWSENVVSSHEGVNYLKPNSAPKCEINAGVDNMMSLVDRLLYRGSPNGGLISQATTRAAKIDELCKSLSREGFRLDWELVGSNDKSELNERNTRLELEFSINGKPSFIWEFRAGHFVVKNLGKAQESWMSRIAPNIANQLAESKAPLHNQGAQLRSPLLLHWFANEKNWEQLGQNKIHSAPKEVQAQLFYALPLNSNEVKLSMFEKVVSNAHSGLYHTAQRLQAKLPQNDLQTQQRIEAALAEADYPQPWGDPLHAAGNPGLKYTRVAKDSEVLAQLGVSFEKSFKTAWKDPRGLIWAGDILRDDQGKKRVLSWEEAKNACFNLNPTQDKREKVKASYESIESNQELIGLRKTYFKERNEETKDLLIKKYTELKQNQVPGCFSPTFEDTLLYGRDQGFLEQGNNFVSRFLKGVYNNWFWSGSGHPDYAASALYFDGPSGQVGNYPRDYDKSVRCVCAAAW